MICVDNKKLLYGVLLLLHTAVSLFFPLSDYLCTRFLTITIPAASAASAVPKSDKDLDGNKEVKKSLPLVAGVGIGVAALAALAAGIVIVRKRVHR